MSDTTPTRAPRRWPFLALGAASFAVLMTVGPIVATRDVDAGGSESDHAGYNVGMMAARSAISAELAVDRVAQPAPSSEGVPHEPAVVPPEITPITAAEAAPPVVERPDPIQDDAIDVTLELTNPALVDGATAAWEITITNMGDEYLWGVYAYLEGLGEIPCGSRQLDVGASTTCSGEQIVWEGDNEAIAWATAWTIDRMAEEETSLAYAVGH